MFFSVNSGNYCQLVVDPSNMRIQKKVGGTWTTLVTNTALSHSNDTWYDLRLMVSRNNAEVWWGPHGETLSLILETGSLQLVSSNMLTFKTLAGAYYRLDNVVFKTDDPETAEFTYGAGNQLASMTAAGLTTEFSYDAHGRLIERSVEINQQEYTAAYEWRFGDKLKRIDSTIPGETSVVQYNYDGLGKRRVKIANGATTWWRWGLGWEPVTQYDESDDDWAVEGFSRFFVGTAAEADVTTTPANATYNYVAQDHLGTGRFLYNQAKTQTGMTEHLPFGSRYEQSGTAPYHEFTGKPWDGESGMYYFPFRYYAPGVGRWIEPDPLGLVDGPNEYCYVKNRPVILFDSLGLELKWVCDMNTSGLNRAACFAKDLQLGINCQWDSNCGCCCVRDLDCEDRCEDTYNAALTRCALERGWIGKGLCAARAYAEFRACMVACRLGAIT